jgi:hypothetical protein
MTPGHAEKIEKTAENKNATKRKLYVMATRVQVQVEHSLRQESCRAEIFCDRAVMVQEASGKRLDPFSRCMRLQRSIESKRKGLQ